MNTALCSSPPVTCYKQDTAFMPVFHQFSLLITSDCSGILTEKGSLYVPLLPMADLFQ